MHKLTTVLTALILLLFLSGPLIAGQSLTVGVVPQFPIKKLHAIWKPILDQLEQDTGYTFIFKSSPDIPTYEKEFLAGQFDIAYMNPYHYLIAADDYRPLVRDTGRQLYGIIVVAKESAIQSLVELEGALIALPAPNALGASLMTRAAMSHEYGIHYQTQYVNTHSSVYLNVALGKATAGGGVQKTFNQQPAHIRERLRVLYQTEKVAPHPIVVHKRLSQTMADTIQAALLKMAATQQGAALLSNVPFKQLGTAHPADYEPLRQLNLDTFYQKPN